MQGDDPNDTRGGASVSFDPLSTALLSLDQSSASRARVLVVDPDVRFGLLLKGFLETRGWGALWVSDGRKALRDWDRLRPDVVVTELDGEDLDGFEFISAVRRRQSTLPIVVCTRLAGAGQWTPSDRRALGVEAVLVRPLQFLQLHSTLEGVLAA